MGRQQVCNEVADYHHPYRAVYVHVPYCRRACSYCDFYFVPLAKAQSDKKFTPSGKQSEPDFIRFTSALVSELKYYENFFKTAPASKNGFYHPATSLNSDTSDKKQTIKADASSLQAFPFSARETASIYFGGGTPSLLPTVVVQKLVADIKAIFFPSLPIDEVEVTIEANPEDVDENTSRGWKTAGITRVSLGVQGVADREFRYLGRKGNFIDSQRALSLLVDQGFDLSADLIIGHPSLSAKNLKTAVDYLTDPDTKVDHLSLYLLNVPEGSALAQQIQSGRKNAPRDEVMISHYRLARRLLLEKSYEHYEVSSFARNRQYSRHNASYWFGHPYLGLGPSAESYNGKNIRRRNIASLKEYCDYWTSDFSQDSHDKETKKIIKPHLLNKQDKLANNRPSNRPRKSIDKKNFNNTREEYEKSSPEKNQISRHATGKQTAYVEEEISKNSLFNEYVMLRLRTGWGVSLPFLVHRFGVSACQHFEKTAKTLKASGLLCHAIANKSIHVGKHKKSNKEFGLNLKGQEDKFQNGKKMETIIRKNIEEINIIDGQNHIKSTNFLQNPGNKQVFFSQVKGIGDGKGMGKGFYYLSEEGLLFSDEIARIFFRL